MNLRAEYEPGEREAPWRRWYLPRGKLSTAGEPKPKWGKFILGRVSQLAEVSDVIKGGSNFQTGVWTWEKMPSFY